MVDCLGAEVDRIEKNLKQKHPEVFWQILYIYSFICSFEKDLVLTIHTKNLGRIMHILLHSKHLLTSLKTD